MNRCIPFRLQHMVRNAVNGMLGIEFSLSDSISRIPPHYFRGEIAIRLSLIRFRRRRRLVFDGECCVSGSVSLPSLSSISGKVVLIWL